MPKPKTYTAKDGTITYRVRFRHGGTNGSETFLTERRAQWFCDQIDEHGSRFALKALADLEEELAGQDSPADSPTLDQLADMYFTWKAPHYTGELTEDQGRAQYRHHISPHLGHAHVDTLSTADIQAWIDLGVAGKILNRRTRKATPLSVSSIRKLHALLSGMLAWACDPARAHLAANPCTATVLPKKKRPVPRGMMPMQWQAMRAAFTSLGYGDAADLGTFLIGSGWRISEAAALPVENVEDYGEGRPMWVTMNQVMRRGKGGSRIAEADGKSASALRRIQVDPDTAAVVRRCCEGKKAGDLVFLWKGERPWQTHNFRDRLEKACAHAGLPHITPHWFRHTHVAWLAMSGAPLPELQRRIGHSSIQTTIGTYGSMIGDVGNDTLAAFTAMRDSTPTVAARAPLQVIEGSTI